MADVILPEPATIQQLNADNLAVTLDGSQVLSHLYAYDSVGDNWDRLRVGGVAGSLLVSLAAGGGAVDTELPAAAALADAAANPTTPTVGADLLFFNGATWDRARGDIANGLDVDVTRVTGTVTVDSELPAAALLADNMANPTVPAVGAFGMLWDGATWDRFPGNSVGGAFIQGPVADGAGAAGNPVTIAGFEGATVRGLTSTQTAADAVAAPISSLSVRSLGAVYNGATWDRMRGDIANGLDVDVTRVTGTTVTVDSELPAAIALADNMANPTVPQVGAHLLVWDGATWDRAPGTSANGQQVQGQVAADAAFNGFPVVIAGTDGGVLARRVGMLQPNADAVAATTFSVVTLEQAHLFNGTTWDRQRNNHEVTALASGARVATTSSAQLTNFNARGAVITLDITATPNNAETLTFSVEVFDTTSGKYQAITAFAALTASVLGAAPTDADFRYTVYPGALETAAVGQHEVQGLALPRLWRVTVTHSAGGSWTYSIGVAYIN